MRTHFRLDARVMSFLDAAGHLSNIEQPEAFSAALIRFLNRCLLPATSCRL
jgi:pimeloyl-ACP methyl ester carboxylesterase